MSKRLYGILSLYLFFAIACKLNKKNDQTDSVLRIKLHKTTDKEFGFESKVTDFLLYSFKEKYPDYYDKLIKEFKNIPELNSSLILSHSFQKEKLYSYLIDNNYIIDDDDKKRAMLFLKDTSKLSAKIYNHQINVVSLFRKNTHLITIDANNNKNFQDDKTFIFQKDFKFIDNINPNPEIVDTLPMIDLKYQVCFKNNIIDMERKVQIFPYSNHFSTQYFIKDSTLRKHALILRVKDYWKGKIKKDEISYTVALQGSNKKSMIYIIKPDSLELIREDSGFIKNFEYRFNDTISISNNLYKIDSITDDISLLILKKVQLNKEFFGYKVGYRLDDFHLNDLEGKKISIADSNKKYILIDFWGTWCKPCKKLTPRLKKMNSNLGNKIEILSIAYDKDLEDVKSYISENQMNWSHAYSKNRQGIIRDLNIISYPTFILLDKNRKILYRGTGESAFNEIEKLFIKKLN